MVDEALVGVSLFALIRFALWVGVVFLGIRVLRGVVRECQKVEDGKPDAYISAIVSKKWGVVGFIFFVTAVLVYSSLETSYRPKIELDSRNVAQEEHEQQIDARAPLTLPESKPLPSWYEERARNRQENEEARKGFSDIPIE